MGWQRDVEHDWIVYTALRDIEVGEELCISYGSVRLWFDDADDAGAVEGEESGEDGSGETLAELELSGLGGIFVDEIEDEENGLDNGKANKEDG